MANRSHKNANRSRKKSPRNLAGGAAVLVMAMLYAWLEPSAPFPFPPAESPTNGTSLSRLFEDHQSGTVVESEGVVVKVLRDDLKGSRHQLFLLETEPDFTILISHNIDLAPRVAGIERGDRVSFRGQYEWNDKGGVVHWTHHDPDRRRPGGWIRHEGQTYR